MPEKKDNFKKKFLLHLGVSILIVAFLGAVLIILGWDINKHVSNISNTRQNIAINNQKADSLASLKIGYEKAKRYMSILENIIPNEEGLIFLNGDLNTLANSDSVDLNFNFGEETKGVENQVSSIAFSITGSSSLNNLFKFLTDIENSRYFFQLNRFEIARQQGEIFKLSTQGKVFSRL